jgi:hypothetical protein
MNSSPAVRWRKRLLSLRFEGNLWVSCVDAELRSIRREMEWY